MSTRRGLFAYAETGVFAIGERGKSTDGTDASLVEWFLSRNANFVSRRGRRMRRGTHRFSCVWPPGGLIFLTTDFTDKQVKQKTNSAVSTIRRLKNTIQIKTGAYLKRFDSAYSGIISTLSIAPKFSSEVRMPYSSFLSAMNWYILFIEPDVPAFTSIGTTLASLTMT